MDKDISDKPLDGSASIFADLKEFLETEFDEVDKHVQDPFKPLTDGLGLESPKRNEAEEKSAEKPKGTEGTPSIFDSSVDESIELDPTGAITKTVSMEHKKPATPVSTPQRSEPRPEPTPVLANQQASTPAPPTRPKGLADVVSDTKVPPPLPTPEPVPWTRRLMAGFLDQLFVFSLWTVSLVITLKIITGSFVGLSGETPIVIRDTDFIQFAIVQYLAIWTCYSVLCLALLDMTFGMWIWGIRVDFLARSNKLLLRKFGRAFLNIFFQALILPTVLLAFRGKKGRNLLDVITGTQIARAH